MYSTRNPALGGRLPERGSVPNGTPLMLNAGLQRQNFGSDQDAVQALVNKVNASQGNLAAMKALGEVNTSQLQESIKLRDLLTSQSNAQAAYMAGEAAKAVATQDSSKVDPYYKPLAPIIYNKKFRFVIFYLAPLRGNGGGKREEKGTLPFISCICHFWPALRGECPDCIDFQSTRK